MSVSIVELLLSVNIGADYYLHAPLHGFFLLSLILCADEAVIMWIAAV